MGLEIPASSPNGLSSVFVVSVLGSESKAFRPGYESSYYIKSKVSVNISPRLLRGLEIIGPRLFWVVVLFTKDPELDPGLRARA